jgi:hypothetical protein
MILISIAAFLSLKVSVIEDRFWFASLSSKVATFMFPAQSQSRSHGEHRTAPNCHVIQTLTLQMTDALRTALFMTVL